MATITSGTGLISGLNTSSIIDQLMALEAKPKDLIKARMDQANQRKLAYTDIMTRLTGLKLSATTLKKASTFGNTSAISSNDNVLSATTTSGAAKGTYQFQVARLVTSQQSVSAGFADTSTTKMTAGSITIEMGGGELNTTATLAQLNGGDGVRRGIFRITDRAGKSAVIDTTSAVTLDDVVKKINTNLDISVKAQVQNDALVLTDLSGQSLNDLRVQDLGGGHAAEDLGISGAISADTLTGSAINRLGRNTALSSLNDGRGIRNAGALADFQITDGNGATYDISLKGKPTLGALFDAIDTATGGKVTASVDGDGKRILLTDNSGGGANLSVAALNGSTAAADLGIENSQLGQITGKQVLASLNTVLVSSLRGGQGLNLGQVSITDRMGNSSIVDFSSANTVQDMIDAVNNNGSALIKAQLKASGNGIDLIDTSGGSGALVVSDVDSSTASELGWAGSATTASVRGSNLQRQWINENSLLATYNGGRGVAPGKFKVTNALGQSADVDLGQGESTLGEVIKEINSKGLGITASINANGDGLLLTDTNASPTGTMKVEELGGTTAGDLGIKATAAGGVIDGTFEKTITVAATDTLSSVQDAINNLAFGASATTINDGSAATPFRLNLAARNTGLAGRFVFDAGATGLDASNLVEAQDAAVFVGGATAAQPVLITSSANKLANVVRGVTIDLHAVGSSPVTLSITENVDNVASEIGKFVDTFNGLSDRLKEFTAYDSTANKKGILLGESTVQTVETEVYGMVQSIVKGAGRYKVLSEVGLKTIEGGKLEFDDAKFRSAYATDADSVKRLFTLSQSTTDAGTGKTTLVESGFGAVIEKHIATLTDPVTGVLVRQNKTLDDRTTDMQARMDRIDDLIKSKRARLERQFANMETVLAKLQSQQSALSGFTGATTTSSTKK